MKSMKNKINVGACFRDSTVFWNEWRVDRIFADSMGLPHAVVVNLSDPTVRRTIACPTLSDPRRYCPIDPGRGRQVAARQAGPAPELGGGFAAAVA